MEKFLRSFVMISLIANLTSCTLTVSNAYTSGKSQGTIDDTATTSPTVSPNVVLPISPTGI